jgi:hypothetical protein
VPAKDQRRNQRFALRLPFELVRSGSHFIRKTGETRNLSSTGVLFTSDAEVQIGEPIEYLITLPSSREGDTVRLRCMGKVVRFDQTLAETQAPPAVAATLERFEFVRSK